MENHEFKTSKNKLVTNDRYLEKLEDIKIRVPKGYREKVKDYAKTKNMNTNQLVILLLNEAMKNDGLDITIPNGVRDLK
jgi:hypothetical protein